MEFLLDEEQRRLRDSVERFVRRAFDVRQRRDEAAHPAGFAPDRWRAMADLGWLAATIAEADGGLGLGLRERHIIMEGLGRGLALEPYTSNAVLAADLVGALGSDAQRQDFLPRIADGSLRVAVALYEAGGRYAWSDARCRAQRVDGGYRIEGEKISVLDVASADRILFLAREDDGDLSLFWIAVAADGLERREFPTLDGRRCADLRLHGVRVPEAHRLGAGRDVEAALDLAIDRAAVATCAEAVGAMSGALEATVDYLKTRRQFGQPLSSFQVLRHRVADMVIATEQARSLVVRAATCLEADPPLRRRMVSAAKVQAGTSGRFVGESAVQLHGGMGMTEEHAVGHYLKRLMVTDMLFGDTAHHLERFAALGSD